MSQWSDLERPPLSAARLGAVLRDDPLWTAVEVRPSTTSTNADVAAAAREGAAEGLVVLAEEQRAGRGRLGRSWEAPARSSVLMSLLLRPDLPVASLPLIPLLTGVAVVESTRGVGEVSSSLKWPNDVLVSGRKLGGILVERLDAAVVVGIGLNVTLRAEERPVETATSLAIEGGSTDREPLVKEMLRSFSRRYRAFVDAHGAADAVMPAYRSVCETIGRQVRIELPGGRTVTGRAVDVDDSGQLLVEDSEGVTAGWSAGDVTHVRSAD
ncbi:MAG TPA: biotin--[acetyl-CoA-carboxylase] ligase [Mycobacteriales bacterium]|nr:biotin--[acetyl-CoA-carboxylase] ligase [Mycobacteriales bacterium]